MAAVDPASGALGLAQLRAGWGKPAVVAGDFEYVLICRRTLWVAR